MTTTLSLDELRVFGPCDLDARVSLFADKDRLSVAEALDAGATVSDICWVAGKLGKTRECVQFALDCAKLVSHLNSDVRVQAALDATQAWLDNPSDAAAAAAVAAARAARAAARAAAYAAARAAARAAAYAAAAYAAAYAADAAAYAAADAAHAARAADAAIREIAIRVFA
jgi:hypothetical protein